jgi:hypothetical protein
MDKEMKIWEQASAHDIAESLEREERQTIFERFDKEFPCRAIGCDNNGSIAERVGDDEWERSQCQYCCEERTPIKSFLRTELEALAKECIGIDQNILLSVQGGKISTGKAVELLQAEVIAAFKKYGIEL